MSYVIQFLALAVVLPLFLAYLKRSARVKAARNDMGVFVVVWSLPMRLLSGMLFVTFGTDLIYLVWLDLWPGENVPVILYGLVLITFVPAAFGALYFWRYRIEYDETSIRCYPIFGKPRQFDIHSFTRAGPVGPRGHRFENDEGDEICVNSLQSGAPDLIDLLQKLTKETYYK
jgi:hypothetical protein